MTPDDNSHPTANVVAKCAAAAYRAGRQLAIVRYRIRAFLRAAELGSGSNGELAPALQEPQLEFEEFDDCLRRLIMAKKVDGAIAGELHRCADFLREIPACLHEFDQWLSVPLSPRHPLALFVRRLRVMAKEGWGARLRKDFLQEVERQVDKQLGDFSRLRDLLLLPNSDEIVWYRFGASVGRCYETLDSWGRTAEIGFQPFSDILRRWRGPYFYELTDNFRSVRPALPKHCADQFNQFLRAVNRIAIANEAIIRQKHQRWHDRLQEKLRCRDLAILVALKDTYSLEPILVFDFSRNSLCLLGTDIPFTEFEGHELDYLLALVRRAPERMTCDELAVAANKAGSERTIGGIFSRIRTKLKPVIVGKADSKEAKKSFIMNEAGRISVNKPTRYWLAIERDRVQIIGESLRN